MKERIFKILEDRYPFPSGDALMIVSKEIGLDYDLKFVRQCINEWFFEKTGKN